MPCRSPLIRRQSKFKCKHSHSHETKKVYKPGRNHSPEWSDDDEDHTDASNSGDEHQTRGRPPASIYIDGRNVCQQNIQLHSCSSQLRQPMNERNRSQHRIVICPRDPCDICRRPAAVRQSHHPNHYCSIHGCSCLEVCDLCPASGRRLYLPEDGPQHQYYVLTGDNGKIDIYYPPKLHKFLVDQADAYDRTMKEKKEKEDAQRFEAFGMIRKLQKHNLLPLEDSPRYERSAEEIRSDLAEVNADLEQLLSKALLETQAKANDKKQIVMEDRLALCSGALRASDDQGCNRADKACGLKQVVSISARPKKVNFTDGNYTKIVNRVKELGLDSRSCHCNWL